MNILVTGGNGYIASVLIPKLEQVGHSVVPYDLPDDIRDIRHLIRYDAVIHLAATFNEDEAISRQINYEETVRLASLARKGQVNMFILASTCGVHNRADESNYTWFKSLAELPVAKKYKYTVLRFATVYGSAPRFNIKPLVNNLVDSAIRIGKIEVFHSNEYRPVIHVADATQAICVVLENRMRGVYNAVTENVTKAEIARLIHDNLQETDITVTPSDRQGYTVERSPQLDKHGFKQTVVLEQGIKEMIDAKVLQSS